MKAKEGNSRIRSAKLLLCLLFVGSCAWLVVLSRFPSIETLSSSNRDDLQRQRIEFPGEPGFWISYPVRSSGKGRVGGAAPVTWIMRKGLKLVRCEEAAVFKDCWGSKLSTVTGGSWLVDPARYEMTGKLYYPCKPVVHGTRNSIRLGDNVFVKDAESAAGDYRRISGSH